MIAVAEVLQWLVLTEETIYCYYQSMGRRERLAFILKYITLDFAKFQASLLTASLI